MRKVVLPVTRILTAIAVNVNAKTVCLVILPLSMVDVTVYVRKLSGTIGFAVFPLALILCSIGPDLRTLAIS